MKVLSRASVFRFPSHNERCHLFRGPHIVTFDLVVHSYLQHGSRRGFDPGVRGAAGAYTT